jgi:hypothetical protein
MDVGARGEVSKLDLSKIHQPSDLVSVRRYGCDTALCSAMSPVTFGELSIEMHIALFHKYKSNMCWGYHMARSEKHTHTRRKWTLPWVIHRVKSSTTHAVIMNTKLTQCTG